MVANCLWRLNVAELRRLWEIYPANTGSLDGWLGEPLRRRSRRANALRAREADDEKKRVRKQRLRQLRADRERMQERQDRIDRGELRCRERTDTHRP